MRILRLVIKNFMPYYDTTIDLTSLSGITAITGRRNGSGAGSNGSGKTSFLSVITWLLFGRIMQVKDRAPAVQNRFHDGATIVGGELELSDGRTIWVERKRTARQTTLEVEGLNGLGTTTGVQESFEKLIGCNFELFTRTVIFGGEVSSFCRLGDAARKELLERLIGVASYASASKDASDQLQTVNDALITINSRVDTLTLQIEESQTSYNRLSRQSEEQAAVHRRDLRMKMESIHLIHERVDDQIDSIINLHDQLEAEQQEYTAAMSRWRSEVTLLEEREAKTQQQVDEARETRTGLESECNTLSTDLSNLKNDKHPDRCPKCNQAWPQNNRHLDDLIQQTERKLSAARPKLVTARSLENKAVAALREVREERKHAESNPPKKGVVRSQLKESLSLLDRHDERLKAAMDDLAVLRRTQEGLDLTEELEGIQTRINSRKEELEALTVEAEECVSKQAVFAFWKDAFNKHGIPEMLLDSSIPLLNESADTYLRYLTDSQAHVNFVLSEGAFEVAVEYDDGSDSYAYSSKGEHTRVDLAVLFAIRRLNSGRMGSAWSQVFLDEVFDGLDALGIERVVRMLRKEFANESVFLITHNDDLQGQVDNTVVIDKSGNDATILVPR